MENSLPIGPLVYVDDDEDDRLFFLEAINEIFPDIKLSLFENGENFMAQMLNEISNDIIPKLIFLDLNMPVMDGYECLSEIKKHSILSKVPVIIYSIASSENDKNRVRNLGASKFLTKELSFKKMIVQLRSTLNEFVAEKDCCSIN
ncbi:Response regulator receiver domain-containing protein [Maribacter dokdonensis]|uniref:response regulator n=1 Tax=Maribacter dokdonensis TaxID=320912 RepID=UPI001B229E1E|nr:response regulator [Maribacter dokdonensis]CAG2533949.1 Response regulator receiver domain-containing protein [Maribacter dokdonensis]